jgi:carbazole 1,9a-dioxygenase terminal dioxygenase component
METLKTGPIEAWEEQRRKPWQEYVEATLGFRNHWYPAFFSHELAEADVSDVHGEQVKNFKVATLLGERILFRRVDGVVHAIQDWCLHRGVPFSTRPECYTKDTITCWYHGFTYDMPTGALKTILTDPGSPLIGKVGLRKYETIEAKGLVWIFIGDANPIPALETDVPKGMLDDTHQVCDRGWNRQVKCNWRPACENGFDPAHVYIHRNSPIVQELKLTVAFGTADISKAQDLEVFDTGPGPYGVTMYTRQSTPIWEADIDGTTVGARFQPGDEAQDESVNNRETPVIAAWMPCSVTASPFPLPGITHYEFLVPVDEDHHNYMITWGMDVHTDEDRARFEELAESGLADRVAEGFSNEDLFAREQLAEFYRGDEGWFRERLFGPDLVITTWRKLASRLNRGIQRRGMQ